MNHTTKLLKKVIERGLKFEVRIIESQFSLMQGMSTKEAIYLLRGLMKRYQRFLKDLYMDSINLKKAYNRVPRVAL